MLSFRPEFLSGVKLFEIKYSVFIRPEGRAWLASNPSAVAGDDGGAGLWALLFFSCPSDSP
jgi:hypothetical protein